MRVTVMGLKLLIQLGSVSVMCPRCAHGNARLNWTIDTTQPNPDPDRIWVVSTTVKKDCIPLMMLPG